MENFELLTLDEILAKLKSWVEQRQVIDAKRWVAAAQSMATLLFDEYDKLADLQQQVAQLKNMAWDSQDKKNVSAVRMMVEASDEYTAMNKQRNKIKNVEEMIRIAKLQGKLREFGG